MSKFTPEIYRRKYDAFCPRYLEGDREKPSAQAVAAAPEPGSLLLERQRQALDHLGSRGRITNRIYMKLARVARKTAYRDLDDLRRRGLLRRQGDGRSVYYTPAHAVAARSEDLEGASSRNNAAGNRLPRLQREASS